jgi:hypothetical protein
VHNRHSLRVLVPPSAPAVPLVAVHEFLSVQPGPDDPLLSSLIASATGAMERYLRASIMPQTLRLTKDGFGDGGDDNILRLGPGVHTASVPYVLGATAYIDLPRGPVGSVLQVVTYDRANQPAVMDAARYDVDLPGARLFLSEGEVWPDNLRRFAAVEIDYTAGYDPVPPEIVHGIVHHVALMYENRGACEMPAVSREIVESHRRFDELGWQ